MPIFASYGSCAYKNSSAKFKQNILTFPFENFVWPEKTAKVVSFGNIWSVFHLTTHEKRKTDQNYQKKTYKILHNTTFFPGMTYVLQKISPNRIKTFLICWPPIWMFLINTGVKLMTVTVIMVSRRWRTWNQVRICFVD